MGKTKLWVAVLSLAALSSPAGAATIVYKFPMTGSQEVPPVTPAGTGECLVTLNDVANQVTVACTYSGLTSNANNAHIHTGAVGVTGGPIVTLAFTAATSGTATVTNSAISAANVTLMKAGSTYINVHSVNNSGGEIRGQVAGQVPAVSTWGLVATAILLITAGTIVLRRKMAVAS
jgi:hypothetical protein